MSIYQKYEIMYTLLLILIIFLFLWALIKGWIWLVSTIMDPKIKAAEKRAKENAVKSPEYQFWSAAEEILKQLNNPLQTIKKNTSEKDSNSCS